MSLLYGIDTDGNKIHIDNYIKGSSLASPLGKPLIAKRGKKVIHHYAHKYLGDRDEWADPLMTEWHYSYQEMCKPECVEVRISKDGKDHIADIYDSTLGLVIELQHSPISDDEIKEREMFYGNMIWLFDYRFQATDNKKRQPHKGTILFECSNYVRVRLNIPPKLTTKSTYFDVGKHVYEYIGNEYDNRTVVWYRKMPKQEFTTKFFTVLAKEEYKGQHPVHVSATATSSASMIQSDGIIYTFDLNKNGQDLEVPAHVADEYKFIVKEQFVWNGEKWIMPTELYKDLIKRHSKKPKSRTSG